MAPPGDGERRKALAGATLCEGVQGPIGGSTGRLTGIAHDACERGEEDEVIQVQVPGLVVE